jgi:hypothetical protein
MAAQNAVADIGVKLTVDTTAFDAGVKRAKGSLQALRGTTTAGRGTTSAGRGTTAAGTGTTTAKVEAQFTKAQVGRALKAASEGLSLTVPVHITQKSIRDAKAAITAGIGSVPVTIQPKFSTSGPGGINNVMGSVLSMQYGISQTQGRALFKETVAKALPAGKARGGYVPARQPVVVGERRPEVFMPEVSGRILPSVDTYRREISSLQAMEQEIYQRQRSIERSLSGIPSAQSGRPVLSMKEAGELFPYRRQRDTIERFIQRDVSPSGNARDWYAIARAQALGDMADFGFEGPDTAGLLSAASLSPGQPWPRNRALFRQLLSGVPASRMGGKEIDVPGFSPIGVGVPVSREPFKQAERMLAARTEAEALALLRGPKVSPFGLNLTGIDPTALVLDRRMARVATGDAVSTVGKPGPFRRAMEKAYESLYRKYGRQLGARNISEFQAILWSSKGRGEDLGGDWTRTPSGIAIPRHPGIAVPVMRMAGGPVDWRKQDWRRAFRPEMVPTSILNEYMGIDREVITKPYQGPEYLDYLTEKIRSEGFDDSFPVSFRYDPYGHLGRLSDGNHRLAVAKRLGIPALPTDVENFQRPPGRWKGRRLPGSSVTFPDEHGYIPRHLPASWIGLLEPRKRMAGGPSLVRFKGPIGKEFEDLAFGRFGETADPRKAGWMSPTGGYLDFSAGRSYRYSAHHRAAELFPGMSTRESPWSQTEWDAYEAMMERNWMRIAQFNDQWFGGETMLPITPSQIARVGADAKFMGTSRGAIDWRDFGGAYKTLHVDEGRRIPAMLRDMNRHIADYGSGIDMARTAEAMRASGFMGGGRIRHAGIGSRALKATLAADPMGGTFPVDPFAKVPTRGHALGIPQLLGGETIDVPMDPSNLTMKSVRGFLGAFHTQRKLGAPFVGTWLDPETGLISVDPSTVIPRKRDADLVLRAGGEKAAWDIAAGRRGEDGTWYQSSKGVRSSPERILEAVFSGTGLGRQAGGLVATSIAGVKPSRLVSSYTPPGFIPYPAGQSVRPMMSSAIDQIRGAPIEHSLTFDREGRLLGHAVGDKGTVEPNIITGRPWWRDPFDEQWRYREGRRMADTPRGYLQVPRTQLDMRGTTNIHNHPSPYGGQVWRPSTSDVGSAYISGSREDWVVTPQHTFVQRGSADDTGFYSPLDVNPFDFVRGRLPRSLQRSPDLEGIINSRRYDLDRKFWEGALQDMADAYGFEWEHWIHPRSPRGLQQRLPGFAAGGTGRGSGLYIVGEIGKELYVPDTMADQIPEKVMDQIPKAAGGTRVIGQKRNELFSPPEDGWIIPNRLLGQVDHLMPRQGGGPVRPRSVGSFTEGPIGWVDSIGKVHSYGTMGFGYGQIMGDEGSFDPSLLTQGRPGPANLAGRASEYGLRGYGFTGSGSAYDPVEGVADFRPNRGFVAGITDVNRPFGTTPRPDEGVPLPDRLPFGEEQATAPFGPGSNPLIGSRGISERFDRGPKVDQPFSNVRTVSIEGANIRRINIEGTGVGSGEGGTPYGAGAPNTRPLFAARGGGAGGLMPEREEYFRQMETQLMQAGQATTTRTPRGQVAVLASTFFGGGRGQQMQNLAEQRAAAKELRAVEAALPAEITKVGPEGKSIFGDYLDALDDLTMATRENHTAALERVESMEADNESLKGWSEASGKYQQTVEKGLPGLKEGIVGLGKVAVGIQLYAMAMQALSFGVGAARPVLQAWTDEIRGWAAISSQATGVLAKQTTEAKGNTEAVLNQYAVTNRLSGSFAELTKEALEIPVAVKSGAETAKNIENSIKTILGLPGGVPPGTFSGFGGPVFEGALLGQAGGFQAIAGAFEKLQPPDIQQQSKDVVEVAVGETVRYFQTGLNALFPDLIPAPEPRSGYRTGTESAADRSVRTEARRGLLEQLNASGVRAQRKFGGELVSFVELDDATAKAIQRSAELPVEIRNLAGSNIGLRQGGEIVSTKSQADVAGPLAIAGLSLLAPETWAKEVGRQFQSQFAVADTLGRRQLSISQPFAAYQQLLQSPIIDPATGVSMRGASPEVRRAARERFGRTRGLQTQTGGYATSGLTMQAISVNEAFGFGSDEQVEFSKAMVAAEGLSASIADYTTEMLEAQKVAADLSFGNQLRLANRGLSDALGLLGDISGSRLGFLQREQYLAGRASQSLGLASQRISLASQELGLALQRRQIATALAVAQFQAPGETGEERYARQREAIIRANIQRRQLGFGEQQFGIGQEQFGIAQRQFVLAGQIWSVNARRAAVDAQRTINVMLASRNAQVTAVSAQKEIAEAQRRMGQWLRRAASIAIRAEAKHGQILNTTGRGAFELGETFVAVDTMLRAKLLGLGPRSLDGKPEGNAASGLIGTTTAATSLTIGEAGAETVAVLRNPRRGSLAGGGGGGGGPINLTININNPSVRNQGDTERLATVVADAVERRLSQKGEMLGLRSPSY